MKIKSLISSFMVFTLLIFSFGFFVHESQMKVSAAVKTSEDYTIADAVLLQKFLLNVPTETDLSDKDYDLDNDGKWNVFDLCLLKRYLVDSQNRTDSDILTIYFSCTNTTEKIANYIQLETNSDIYEIIPEVPYTAEDISYTIPDTRANIEQNDPTARPAISGSIPNFEQYDTVFIGYPIWWGQEPRIIDTFMESYDFSGKTVIPFSTSSSSGIGTSETNLHNLGSDKIDWLAGRRFSASAKQSDVADWIKSLNILNSDENAETFLNVTVGSRTFTATLEKNVAVDAFVEMLKESDIKIKMSDYSGFEKVGSLGKTLPTDNSRITTKAGDIVLYNANQIVAFYGSNTWSYTKLAEIDDLTGWEDALGKDDVEITFSLADKKTGKFNFNTKTVMLNSGYEMPIMGLGTYSLSDEDCYNSVITLLENGGRLIDTAYMYHNEAAVGRAVRESGISREEIFVTTKLYPNQFDNPEQAIDDALERMGLDYIDLMLLHHPGTNDVNAYKAMEQAVRDGKIRSIGLSNWYIEELEDFLPQVTITPAVVQNEIHPYYQERNVVPYIQEKGIVVEGWYPFGGRGYTRELLGNETINTIAENHGVTAAQVILRWNLQRGVIVIPGSSNPDHIKENLDIYGFSLNDKEMSLIALLNKNEKHDWY